MSAEELLSQEQMETKASYGSIWTITMALPYFAKVSLPRVITFTGSVS